MKGFVSEGKDLVGDSMGYAFGWDWGNIAVTKGEIDALNSKSSFRKKTETQITSSHQALHIQTEGKLCWKNKSMQVPPDDQLEIYLEWYYVDILLRYYHKLPIQHINGDLTTDLHWIQSLGKMDEMMDLVARYRTV